jgi:hypothetical protein
MRTSEPFGLPGKVGRRSLSLAALACLLSACTSAATTPGGSTSGGSVTTPRAAPKPSSCGELPSSTGPAADLAKLVLSAAASGHAGQQIAVTATVVVTADGQRVISVPNGSELLIILDGKVVGKTDQGGHGSEIPLILKAGTTRPGQALPQSVQLSGCPTGAQTARSPLPAGSYQLVGVLGYRADPFNSGVDGMQAGGLFQLVSEPLPIRVD